MRLAVLSIFLIILLLAFSLLSFEALGATNATAACPEFCWTMTAPPSYRLDATDYYSAVNYHNGFNSSVKGTAYFVMRNQLGQTVAIDSTTTTVSAGGNATLHPSFISQLFPPGNYSTYFFAVSNATGVAISNETVGSLESTYSVFINGTSESYSGQTGPINLSLTIQSVSPTPVIVNVTVMSSNPQTHTTLWQNQTEISIPAMSSIALPPMMVGTGGLPPCQVNVTVYMQDPSGKNLSPPAGASVECGPP